jgi:hypothetical protein
MQRMETTVMKMGRIRMKRPKFYRKRILYVFVEEWGEQIKVGYCFKSNDSPNEGYDQFCLYIHHYLFKILSIPIGQKNTKKHCSYVSFIQQQMK